MATSRRQRNRNQFGPYADFIREQHCCGCGAWPPNDPHHYRTRGAHGDASQSFQIPLCRRCHSECHNLGVETFQKRKGVDFAATRERLMKEWECKHAETY